MESNTNLSVHGNEMGDIINQPNTRQMEEHAEDTLNGFTAPTCRDSTSTGHVVVLALPCDQSSLSRGKKANDQRVEGSRRTSKRKMKELCDKNAIMDVAGAATATVPIEHEDSPFEKNKLLRGVAESLEEFSRMPKKPHFRPLESYREIQREGEALSLIVLFNKLTKKSSNLRYDAPREDIENDLSILKKLETHGFDVIKLRDDMTMMLLLKDKEDCENISKEHKRQLTEFDRTNCKAKEKRIKMEDEIIKLKEVARLSYLGEEEIDDKSAFDQLVIRELDDKYTRIRMEIKELVASPLY